VERCVACQYYDRNRRGSENKAPNAGQCRRTAPALSPLNQKSYMIEGVWPTVRDDDWCGEWKAPVRRVDPSRLGDMLAAPLPSVMPPSPVSAGGLTSPLSPSFSATPSSVPRISTQAARAALGALGIDSRPGTVPPLPNLAGTGGGDD
jgi:hypothetical protein